MPRPCRVLCDRAGFFCPNNGGGLSRLLIFLNQPTQRVPHPSFFEGWESVHSRPYGSSRNAILKRNLLPTFVYPDVPKFIQGIKPATAPTPILRRGDQTSLNRILMHVIQLLHALFRGPDVEVVESCLPKRRAFRSLSKQVRLSRITVGRPQLSSLLCVHVCVP